MHRFMSLLAAGTLVFTGAACSSGQNASTPAQTSAPAADSQAATLPSVPFTRFTLPNGLTVVVSEDHKAPVVAVALWYHVGSAREPAGKSGYAHLFEHLMFGPSEHHKGEYFSPFEKVGATGMNGTTNKDRTNYFETVPTTAVDMALWMESDRMGWLLQGLDQAGVDEQRGVVQNEKRQGENQPMGIVGSTIAAHAYPANHPYHHSVIGSMKDLDAASLADFKTWFKTYYGPNNATLVLVGDITPAEAKAKALKYFGNIEPSAPVAKLQPWVFPRSTSTSGTVYRHVPQTHLIREWNTPPFRSHDDGMLDLAASVLGGGKTSRLYQRLVYKDKLADSVSVYQGSSELGSQFTLNVAIKKGVDPAKVEAAVANVWSTFLKEGPTTDELDRAKTGMRASFVRRLEKVGGFGGKAVLLASAQVFNGDPNAWRKSLKNKMDASAADVLAAANKWIAKGDYTLMVLPVAEGKQQTTADEATAGGLAAAEGKPELATPAQPESPLHTVASEVDRSKGVPEVTQFPSLTFPKVQHAKLDNGIEVTLATRHSVPLVEMTMQFGSGHASDQGHKLGRANFAMGMLQEGTSKLDSVQISNQKQRLGANINTGCGLDACSVTLNSLTDKLDKSLNLFASVIRDPAFRKVDMERERGLRLAGIAREQSSPIQMAIRVLPPLLFGEGHPYAMPLSGSGTVDSIKAMTADDLKAFMGDYIRPDNARILVAGDITMDQLLPKLNKAFGQWQAPSTPVPQLTKAKVAVPEHDRVYMINVPEAVQSVIVAGVVAPSGKAPNHLAIQTMNGVFGGTFTSRLNMDLREDKHWSYGARSMVMGPVGPGTFMMYAPVQTNKTAPSVKQMVWQAKAIVGDKPITAAEVQKIKDKRVHAMPGQYQTNGAVLGTLASNALYDRPDDYVTTLKSRIDELPLKSVQDAANEVIQPGHLTWVVVGDLSKVGKSVRDLKLGPVQVLDATGKPVKAGK